MQIAVCVRRKDELLGDLLEHAVARSFTRSQVRRLAPSDLASACRDAAPLMLLLARPDEQWIAPVEERAARGDMKLAVFGELGPRFAALLGVTVAPLPDELVPLASCEAAPAGQFRESELVVRYLGNGLGAQSPHRARPFLRYDFANEWNNLGFGAIRTGGSIWSLAQLARPNSAAALADVARGAKSLSAYASLLERGASSLLWFNRAVGPIDSLEWRVVETFFANHRPRELPCAPLLQEVPCGWDAAVTMRLDCDEDVASAEELFAKYREWGIPFSLAIKTSLLDDPRHHALPKSILAAGGSLLSHSATHQPNWGPDFAGALVEAEGSRARLQESFGDAIRYAVSPFHQNPPYAVRALARAGYSGFVAGIVANDPEYLVARGGEVLAGPEGFVSHSQQCMLHGDTMLAEGDPLRICKQGFLAATRARGLFGYLDHPFSERYQYGWPSEGERIVRHRELIEFMRAQGRILFLSENDALDFVRAKAMARFAWNGTERFTLDAAASRAGELGVEYRGTVRSAREYAAS